MSDEHFGMGIGQFGCKKFFDTFLKKLKKCGIRSRHKVSVLFVLEVFVREVCVREVGGSQSGRIKVFESKWSVREVSATHKNRPSRSAILIVWENIFRTLLKILFFAI